MKSKNLDKVLKMFALMWVLTGIGFFIGQFVPTLMSIIISGLTLMLILGMIVLKRNKVAGYILGYLTSLLLGVTLYPTISLFSTVIGLKLTIIIIATSVLVFAAVGLFGYKTSKNLSGLGNILIFLLLALVVFSFLSIFFSFSNFIMLISGAIGLLVFIGYTIYDFNQLSHMGDIKDEDVPLLAINLYLDLFNFIMQAFKFICYTMKFLEED